MSACAYESHNVTTQVPAAPDVLLEPGKILAQKDIQIPFKTTIGESAQNSPGPGPYLFFPQPVAMASVPVRV